MATYRIGIGTEFKLDGGVGIATFNDTVRVAGITTFASTSHINIPSELMLKDQEQV